MSESAKPAKPAATPTAPAKPAKPAKAAPGSFDRIPSGRKKATGQKASETDMQGKQALFSRAAQPPPVGSAAIECGKCKRRSVVTLVRLAQLSVPGIHIPSSGGGHRALLKCPACDQRSWVKVTLR